MSIHVLFFIYTKLIRTVHALVCLFYLSYLEHIHMHIGQSRDYIGGTTVHNNKVSQECPTLTAEKKHFKASSLKHELYSY